MNYDELRTEMDRLSKTQSIFEILQKTHPKSFVKMIESAIDFRINELTGIKYADQKPIDNQVAYLKLLKSKLESIDPLLPFI